MVSPTLETRITVKCLDKVQHSESDKILKVVKYLLMKESNLEGVLSKSLARQILLKCEPVLFSQFAHALQEALSEIDISDMNEQKELFIANIIALIPYSYPKENQSFLIPIKNEDGVYERRKFECEKVIPMSISTCITPLNAYAFRSEVSDNMLLFTGTTFPAGGGFLNSLIADFTAFSSVGKLPFGMGYKTLEEYFNTHSSVKLYGMSLGGALCLHAFRHFEDKIKDVYAVVPAGLHLWDSFNKKSDKKVVILMQEGDIVSKLGYFPEHEGVKLYHLKAGETATKGLYAHARAFTGSSNSTIKNVDVKKINRSFFRRIITILHIAFSWLVFLFLMPVLAYHKIKEITHLGASKAYEFFNSRPAPSLA